MALVLVLPPPPFPSDEAHVEIQLNFDPFNPFRQLLNA